MLGLVLIYFLGKYYYDLAKLHDKNAWGHAILGVVTYYAGTFVGGIIVVLAVEFSSPGSIDGMNDYGLGLIALPFGLLAAWGLYKYLHKRYANALKPQNPDSDILDEGIF